jgi:fused signal recognition particle receptor
MSEKKSWFSRLKDGLKKSSTKITTGISEIFTHRKLDDDALEELEDILITADMGVNTSAKMVAEIAKNRFNKEVSDEEIKNALAIEIEKILTPNAKELEIDSSKKPFVVLMTGVNGAGKTTTIGKIANQLTEKGLKVSMVAGDTFRAAAVEQIKVWGERTNCRVASKEIGSDAASLVFDALKEAIDKDDDVVLIDTAGRLQNKEGLMEELKKIVRVIKKIIPEAPHANLLVLDATVGQNAHSQVKIFDEMVDISGLIVTKLDGTAKGGVVVSLAEKFNKPVHYIGVGEQAEDLRPFSAKDFAHNLMGI